MPERQSSDEKSSAKRESSPHPENGHTLAGNVGQPEVEIFTLGRNANSLPVFLVKVSARKGEMAASRTRALSPKRGALCQPVPPEEG